MHIESVTIQNFRCFGPTKTIVKLGPEITALIGGNGAGKSAFIDALRKLFSLDREDRRLTQSDVHFGPNETPEGVATRQIVIDVVLAVPELEDESADAALTVPLIFHSMTAIAPGKPLKARMRLEAVWTFGESLANEIEVKYYWIKTLKDVEFGEDGEAMLDKRELLPMDRSRIQLVHFPATRDGAAVTKQALRQLLDRLERSGNFDGDTEKKFMEVSNNVQDELDALPAIGWIRDKLKENWSKLHKEHHLTNPKLVILSKDFDELLKSLVPEMSPAPGGRARSLQELSEGQTSLFFLALTATLTQLEGEIASGKIPDGFTESDVNPAALTIYAVEEPENHLAPFYLSRMMNLLSELCMGNQAMGIVSSHSPSTMRRIDPTAVRHFRLDSKDIRTRINAIHLPSSKSEAAKFVRQAVIAQPEIYFANLVILGEGDSEAIVIPRIAKAMNKELDPAFVAFAPLGGRHVNYFWKLLRNLRIPTLTLLDLDIGRKAAGPYRIKYAIKQLLKIKTLELPDWFEGDVDDNEYWKSLSNKDFSGWQVWLRKHKVYFSGPLDLDMMMLQAFHDAYEVDEVSKSKGSKYEEIINRSVFGLGTGLDAYSDLDIDEQRPTYEELVAYDKCFKKRGKPGSHISALANLTDEQLIDGCPEILKKLIERADRILHPQLED